MVTNWHRQDDPDIINVHDLLKHKKVAQQKLSENFKIDLFLDSYDNLKEEIYRNLIIMLAKEGMNTREISKTLNVPVRTLTYHINKLF